MNINEKNNKDDPAKCESRLCCKATANLEIELKKDMSAQDRAIAELFSIAESGCMEQEDVP